MKKIIVTDRVKQNIPSFFFEALADVEALTAYSNADALRIHRKEQANVIITELYGSGMNARQFCQQIREDDELRGVSVIICCRDNEIERQEASQSRANAVFTFPLPTKQFVDTVHRFLDIPLRGRYQARFSARKSGSPRASIDCRTENISVTGMLIETASELNRGDMLHYSLDLAPARSFTMEAEVVRADRGRYGIRFFRLDPGARRAIEALVSSSPSAR